MQVLPDGIRSSPGYGATISAHEADLADTCTVVLTMRNRSELVTRVAGVSSLLAGTIITTGMVLYALAGADLETAVNSGDMAAYFAAAVENHLLVVTLFLWMIASLLIVAAATALAVYTRSLAGWLGTASATVGAAVALPTYLTMLALINVAAPNGSREVAEVIGWAASRGDWTATVLLLSVTPMLLSMSGAWHPQVQRWLVALGATAALSGLTAVAALFGIVPSPTGYAVLLAGPLWLFAAGAVTLRASAPAAP
ncbi:hypothetical protein [Hoyosella subflava]|uniref:Integral membrane protein n=1 Tax=Hoyosella subflava (strain DSM 45089 / JCM 17490 / NBRC 109087 / DQS3-9A1) TaxID=443218 RepID=F6EH52_HOYSD|nr:hypothetical protein [Hoyosella subflava]AEF39889.1 hypothetical protein AS9A_1437 [Hoyosella subflava DQS3-9A1]